MTRLNSVFFLIFNTLFLVFTPFFAQQSNILFSDTLPFSCSPVYPSEKTKKRAFSPQIFFEKDDTTSLIKKSHAIKVFRLAVFISNEYYTQHFQENNAKVYAYWDKLETYLNNLYTRDCGIRFKLIKSDELISSSSFDPLKEGYSHNEIIKKALGGEQNYEIGIVLRKAIGQIPGQAFVGGVLHHSTKAEARATLSFTTIAHELGHLLGANHLHEKNDAIVLEKGAGNSIMTYGLPRNFFSLYSIKEITQTIDKLPYYTDSLRTTLINKNSRTTNAPYIASKQNETPILNRSLILPQYTVTKGTAYQFYIPTQNRDTTFNYLAHQIDPTKFQQENNLVQPIYASSKYPCIMFHERYLQPGFETDNYGNKLYQYYPNSNAYEIGEYTYWLSAYKAGQHDAVKTKLKIVEGKPFRITKFLGISRTKNEAIAGKTKVSLEWEPCLKLYGENSKVRILLSTNFGKTFDYVLANEVPNNGRWSGVLPFINIGIVDYPEITYTPEIEDNFGTIFKVRGGIIKVEVVNQAAYALTAYKPYTIYGTRVEHSGGFTLTTHHGITFSPQLSPNISIKNLSELPAMQPLVASKGTKQQTIMEEREQVGNTIYRRWKTTIDGTQTTFTQIVILEKEIDSLFKKASILKDFCVDIYNHIGQLGYPRKELAIIQKMQEIYLQIYTKDGNILPTLTEEALQAMEEILIKLNDLTEQEIVMPLAGIKYKIASYHHTFKGDKLFFLKWKDAKEDQLLSEKAKDNATSYYLKRVDNLYQLTALNGGAIGLSETPQGLNGLRIVRGKTWGTFSFISGTETPAIAIVDRSGTSISMNDNYYLNPALYKENEILSNHSSDFCFFPAFEAYKIYLHQSHTAEESFQINSNSLPIGQEKEGLYSVMIPTSFTANTLTIVVNQKEIQIPLYGREEHYLFTGERCRIIDLQSDTYATFFADYPVILPPNLKAYIGEYKEMAQEKSGLHLIPIEQTIPAFTPVLLQGLAPKEYLLTETSLTTNTAIENAFMGTLGDAYERDLNSNFHYYILSERDNAIHFRTKEPNEKLASNVAYFRIHKNTTSLSEILPIIIHKENQEETITSLLNKQKTFNNKYAFKYNLQGIQLNEHSTNWQQKQKLYIKGKKKFLAK